jgi:hypothetical protein
MADERLQTNLNYTQDPFDSLIKLGHINIKMNQVIFFRLGHYQSTPLPHGNQAP